MFFNWLWNVKNVYAENVAMSDDWSLDSSVVDTENVAAKMNNGVQTIILPKLEFEEARQIEIE